MMDAYWASVLVWGIVSVVALFLSTIDYNGSSENRRDVRLSLLALFLSPFAIVLIPLVIGYVLFKTFKYVTLIAIGKK